MILNRPQPEQRNVQAPREVELSADLVSLQKLKALLAELELQLKADDNNTDEN